MLLSGRLGWLAWLAILAFACTTLAAHEMLRSESKLEVRGREIRATLTFNLLDFAGVDQDSDKKVATAEFDRAFDRVYASILDHYRLDSNGPPARITREKFLLTEDHVLTLGLLYLFPQDVLAFKVTSTLPEVMGKSHVHLAAVAMMGRLQQSVLDSRHREEFFTQTSGSSGRTFLRFLWLGIQHIATGYDHLAFLAVLLIATPSMRSLVKVVTSFTIAHSITLALATFDIVVLPSRFTESMIAASIVYVAAENLIRGRAIERYRITFLFGLVHGFGFSNVLREMQLPRANLALSLFSFNLGVEVGQLIFVLLLYPAVGDLIRGGRTWLRPAVSACVALLAAYWFIQRAFIG